MAISGIEVLKDIKHISKLSVLNSFRCTMNQLRARVYAPAPSGYIIEKEAVANVILALRKILNGEVYLSERRSFQGVAPLRLWRRSQHLHLR